MVELFISALLYLIFWFSSTNAKNHCANNGYKMVSTTIFYSLEEWNRWWLMRFIHYFEHINRFFESSNHIFVNLILHLGGPKNPNFAHQHCLKKEKSWYLPRHWKDAKFSQQKCRCVQSSTTFNLDFCYIRTKNHLWFPEHDYHK